MKISDVKVGQKYYSLSSPLHDKKCGYWKKAKEENQPYLYCTHVDERENRVLLNFYNNKGVGTAYSPEVLIPFVRLTKEDLVLGNKYVPIAKTSGSWAEEEFEKYGEMRAALERNQPYLYYAGWDEDYAMLSSEEGDDGGDYYNPEDLLPYVEPDERLFKNPDMNAQKPSKDQFVVDRSFIKQAYNAACPKWKQKLKNKFPNAFKPEVFDFGRDPHTLSSRYNGLPFMVGHNLAPVGKEGKCLFVSSQYTVKLTEHKGRTIIEFIKQ